MPRAALFALLVTSVLHGSLQAQRTAPTFLGNAAGQHVHAGLVARRNFPGRAFPNGSHRRDRFGAYFFPYDGSFGYEQTDVEAVPSGPSPPGVLPPAPETPLPKAQVIEIPSTANSIPAKALPPTIFILANGERLETRRYVLTANNLSLTIDRNQRNVPLALLNLDATIATNHERGIDLRIPDDRNEISVSF